MKQKEIETGWVVTSMNGTFIIPSTFARTRTDSISKWMKIWDEKRTNWRKLKKQGYKCVKAKQTIEIE